MNPVKSSRIGQRGEGKVGCTISFLVLVILSAFAIKVVPAYYADNQISDIVTTMFGFHIIKLLEKIPAQKVEFAKVAPEIKDALLTQELQRAMPEHFDKLKKEAGVEVLEPKYRLDPPRAAASRRP